MGISVRRWTRAFVSWRQWRHTETNNTQRNIDFGLELQREQDRDRERGRDEGSHATAQMIYNVMVFPLFFGIYFVLSTMQLCTRWFRDFIGLTFFPSRTKLLRNYWAIKRRRWWKIFRIVKQRDSMQRLTRWWWRAANTQQRASSHQLSVCMRSEVIQEEPNDSEPSERAWIIMIKFEFKERKKCETKRDVNYKWSSWAVMNMQNCRCARM